MTTRNGERRPRRAVGITRDFKAAVAHHRAGRLDRAEALYNKVLQRVPDHGVTLNLRGTIALARGQHEHAVQLISRALSVMPESAEAHLNLGGALRGLGRLDEAAASCRRAIALLPLPDSAASPRRRVPIAVRSLCSPTTPRSSVIWAAS